MDRIAELEKAINDIRELLESMPAGIDYEADPNDASPENMEAHIGGLAWQICERTLPSSR